MGRLCFTEILFIFGGTENVAALDSITVILKQLVNEALQQSPNNPESNGFGFGMAILVVFCGLCLAGLALAVRSYIRMVRDRDRERRLQAKQDREDRDKARESAAKQIDGRIDKLEGLVADELGNIRKHVNDFLREHESKYANTREELAILKEKVNHLEKK